MKMKRIFILLFLLFLSAAAIAANVTVDESNDVLVLDGKLFVSLDEVAGELSEPLDWFFRADSVRVRLGDRFFDITDPTMLQGRLMVSTAFLQELEITIDLLEEVADIDLKAAPRLPEDLHISVKTDRSSYRPGDQIAVSMIIHNTKSQSVNVQFNTGQVYDLFLKKNGMVAWGWSRDKAFTQAFHSITFEPEEVRHYAFLIPTKELRFLEKGEYLLQGVLTSHPEQRKSEPLKIEIK